MEEEKKDLSNLRQKCEVWSRVCGYLRPLNQWNDGAKARWNDTVKFKTEDDVAKKE
jgi:anaerobic ribonucleoside-triphosphate reductase